MPVSILALCGGAVPSECISYNIYPVNVSRLKTNRLKKGYRNIIEYVLVNRMYSEKNSNSKYDSKSRSGQLSRMTITA